MRRPPTPLICAATLTALLGLSSCSGLLALTGNKPTTSTPPSPPQPLVRRIVQLDLGRHAHFAHCIEPACPAPTRKTLAVAAIPPSVQARPASAPTPDEASFSSEHRPPQAPHATKAEVLTLLFATDSAALTAQHRSQLNQAAAALGRADRILIVGRTDNVGPTGPNESIALSRASQVRDHLMRLRPRLTQDIRIDARGLCCCAAPNDTADGRAKNRRVEVVFTPSPEVAP